VPAACCVKAVTSSELPALPPQDRRVEITGPTDRKMVINALNRWGERLFCLA